MDELILNDQIVLYDRVATVSAYRSIDWIETDQCSCNACKNFWRFRDVAYGPKLLRLLECIGVDRRKVWEVFWSGEEKGIDGRILYGGWFPFVGEWSPSNSRRDARDLPKQDESFYFSENFPNATQKFGTKVLAVEFFVDVPKSSDYISDFE
jgi:hypothetical protein